MYHIGPDVSFGSTADSHDLPLPRPLSGVKQTSNVRFQGPMQFFPGNVRFRGQSGRSRHGPKDSVVSHKQTISALQDLPHFGTSRCRWREPSTASRAVISLVDQISLFPQWPAWPQTRSSRPPLFSPVLIFDCRGRRHNNRSDSFGYPAIARRVGLG